MNKQNKIYLIESIDDHLAFYNGYTDNEYIANTYMRQLEKEKPICYCREILGDDGMLLRGELGGTWTKALELKPYLSHDKSILIVMTDHFRRFIFNDVTGPITPHIAAYISTIAEYITWLIMLFQQFSFIRENFTEEQLSSFQTLNAYAWLLFKEGLSECMLYNARYVSNGIKLYGAVDVVMLVSAIWGWGKNERLLCGN